MLAQASEISAEAADLIYACIALVATVWILIEIWSYKHPKGKR